MRLLEAISRGEASAYYTKTVAVPSRARGG